MSIYLVNVLVSMSDGFDVGLDVPASSPTLPMGSAYKITRHSCNDGMDLNHTYLTADTPIRTTRIDSISSQRRLLAVYMVFKSLIVLSSHRSSSRTDISSCSPYDLKEIVITTCPIRSAESPCNMLLRRTHAQDSARWDSRHDRYQGSTLCITNPV